MNRHSRICLLALFLAAVPLRADDLDLGPIPDFVCKERDGREINLKDEMRGKVWVASFIFTRCAIGCPHVTATMARLQEDLHLVDNDDLRLVSFTVDPKRDEPDDLKKYAEQYRAHPMRWLFLTCGDQEEMHRLIEQGFKLSVAERPPDKKTPGDEFEHATKLVVVDQRGHIRGFFDGMARSHHDADQKDFETNLDKLKDRVNELRKGQANSSIFPLLNASLNGAAGVLLVIGYVAIRRRAITLHKTCMISAVVVSAIFLSCYLYYHLVIQKGRPTRFVDRAPDAPSWVAALYLTILLSHTVLAAIVTPMALVTTYRGLKDQRKQHIRLARWTFPIWLYVSITGVVVYWMLYQLYPSPGG